MIQFNIIYCTRKIRRKIKNKFYVTILERLHVQEVIITGHKPTSNGTYKYTQHFLSFIHNVIQQAEAKNLVIKSLFYVVSEANFKVLYKP